MKKIMSLVLVLSLLLSLGITASAATTTADASITYRSIKLVLDGKEIIPCDAAGNTTEPFIMGGTTYLPLRAVAQALGLGVKWIPETSTVQLTSGGEVKTGTVPSATSATKTVKITYRDIKVFLDGVQLELKNANGDTVEPFIMDGTTYLPLRIIGEALDLGVNWDPATSTVAVKQPEAKPEEPSGDKWLVSFEKYTDSDGYSYSQERSFYPDGSIECETYSDSGGMSTTMMYDETGRVVYCENTDPEHTNSERYIYGENGRVASISYCHVEGDVEINYVDVYSWDGDVALVSTIYDGETQSAYSHTVTEIYDANGKLLKKHTDYGEFSVTEENRYDQWGNLVYTSYTDSDGYSNVSSFTYDANGNLLSYSYDGPYDSYTTTSTYDAKGNEIYSKYVGTEGTAETWYTYDAAGRLTGGTRKMDNGSEEVLTISYDAAGRQSGALTIISYADGSSETITETYSYDSNGNASKIFINYSNGLSITLEYEYVPAG